MASWFQKLASAATDAAKAVAETAKETASGLNVLSLDNLQAELSQTDTKKNTYSELDVTFLTSRLIAMGFPSSPTSRIRSRNEASTVGAFFRDAFGSVDQVLVLNLSDQTYDTSVFAGNVLDVSFPGYPSPPLGLIFRLCQVVEAWLAADPGHVVAIHCTTGRGRTVVLAAAVLAWLGEHAGGKPPQTLLDALPKPSSASGAAAAAASTSSTVDPALAGVYWEPLAALGYVAGKRGVGTGMGTEGQGQGKPMASASRILAPSQVRYCGYADALLDSPPGAVVDGQGHVAAGSSTLDLRPLVLRAVVLHGLPDMSLTVDAALDERDRLAREGKGSGGSLPGMPMLGLSAGMGASELLQDMSHASEAITRASAGLVDEVASAVAGLAAGGAGNGRSSRAEDGQGGCRPQLQVFVGGRLVYSSGTGSTDGQDAHAVAAPSDSAAEHAEAPTSPRQAGLPPLLAPGTTHAFTVGTAVQGDVLIRCRHLHVSSSASGAVERETVFRTAVHTAMLPVIRAQDGPGADVTDSGSDGTAQAGIGSSSVGSAAPSYLHDPSSQCLGHVVRLSSSDLDVACTDPRVGLYTPFAVDLIFGPHGQAESSTSRQEVEASTDNTGGEASPRQGAGGDADVRGTTVRMPTGPRSPVVSAAYATSGSTPSALGQGGPADTDASLTGDSPLWPQVVKRSALRHEARAVRAEQERQRAAQAEAQAVAAASQQPTASSDAPFGLALPIPVPALPSLSSITSSLGDTAGSVGLGSSTGGLATGLASGLASTSTALTGSLAAGMRVESALQGLASRVGAVTSSVSQSVSSQLASVTQQAGRTAGGAQAETSEGDIPGPSTSTSAPEPALSRPSFSMSSLGSFTAQLGSAVGSVVAREAQALRQEAAALGREAMDSATVLGREAAALGQSLSATVAHSSIGQNVVQRAQAAGQAVAGAATAGASRLGRRPSASQTSMPTGDVDGGAAATSAAIARPSQPLSSPPTDRPALLSSPVPAPQPHTHAPSSLDDELAELEALERDLLGAGAATAVTTKRQPEAAKGAAQGGPGAGTVGQQAAPPVGDSRASAAPAAAPAAPDDIAELEAFLEGLQ